MIEWKKWNGEMLPNKQYLIHVLGEVKVAMLYWYKPGGPEEGCPAWEVDADIKHEFKLKEDEANENR